MTTNQTIDGVPRDYVLRLTPQAHSVVLGMVEHCLNVRACMGMDEGFKDFDTEEEHDFVKELRALVDGPVCKVCNDTKQMHEPGSCAACFDGEVAHPQDAPVARQPDAIIEGVMTSVGISHAIYASTVTLKHGEQVKLYAEQPAPVAVVLPERQEVDKYGEFYDSGWNDCLDELKRLNPSL